MGGRNAATGNAGRKMNGRQSGVLAGPASGISRRAILGKALQGALCIAGAHLVPVAGIRPAEAAPNPARPGTPLDNLVPVIRPSLVLRNANTGEIFSGSFYSRELGSYDMTVIEQLNWFLRDWRRREVKMMDPRLYWALAAISQGAQAEGHSGEILVTSGYRTRQTNSRLEGAARNSLHIQGRDIDFAMEGVPTRAISDYMIWLKVGGVGHYPGRFVHIDSGRVRVW